MMFGQSRTYTVRYYPGDDPAWTSDDDYEFVSSGLNWESAKALVDGLTGPVTAGKYVIHAEDAPQPLVVTIALWDRAYGGPEEGGWWYDTWDPIDSEAQWLTHEAGGPWLFAADQSDAASAKCAEINRAIDNSDVNHGRIHPNSVNSTGHYRAVIFEGWPRQLPERKPNYE